MVNTEHHIIGGTPVEVRWKAIKNLHVGVYPPDGQVRVAAPLSVSLDAVKLAVLTRMDWVRRKQARFLAQERQTKRQYVSGETHFVFGQPLRLDVIYWDKKVHRIELIGNDRLRYSVSSRHNACSTQALAGELVQGSPEGARGSTARALGIALRRWHRNLGHPAHENEMGQLQSGQENRLA